MINHWMIYGCYGYTGKLITEHAASLGMKPVLAGRKHERVKELAEKYGFDYRVFDAEKSDDIVKNLQGVKVLLHCAGPFRYTVDPMVKACIANGTHYLDITGEFDVFEKIFRHDDEAKRAGIILMPGVGFDVVPSDCLANYLKEKLPTANNLELALYTQGSRFSHGTAITVVENMGEGCTVRRNGKLTSIPSGSLTRPIKILQKSLIGVSIPWGDISTAFRSTRIPNITVYQILPPKMISNMKLSHHLGFLLRNRWVKNFLISRIKKGPAGPDKEQRQKAVTYIWGEVKNKLGVEKRALLQLPEGYTLTYLTAVESVRRLLNDEVKLRGALTPAQAFGSQYILSFEGTKITDL